MITVGRGAWALLATLGLCGCSSDPFGVGAECTDGLNCGDGANAACIRAWPQGYCTEFGCSLGSCPEGARCVSGIQFADVPFETYCLATCTGASDCRENYRCAEIGAAEKVCAPALP